MALRSGYKGFKKLLGLKTIRPGTLAVDDAALANTFFPRSEQAVLGAKNLLDVILATTTKNGVTATVNNGVVSTSGTSEQEWVTFVLNPTVLLKAGKYILSGISGGASNTYRLTVSGSVVDDFVLYDGEQEFTITADGTVSVTLYVRQANVDMSGKVFYPMIRLATDTDPTYVPYAMTNKELTDVVQGIINAASNAADFAAFKTAIGNL